MGPYGAHHALKTRKPGLHLSDCIFWEIRSHPSFLHGPIWSSPCSGNTLVHPILYTRYLLAGMGPCGAHHALVLFDQKARVSTSNFIFWEIMSHPSFLHGPIWSSPCSGNTLVHSIQNTLYLFAGMGPYGAHHARNTKNFTAATGSYVGQSHFWKYVTTSGSRHRLPHSRLKLWRK